MKKSNGYWTKEKCHEVALMCQLRSQFEHKYKRAYENCRVNGWLEEICSHMIKEYKLSKKLKPDGYWNNKENCINAILECNNLKEFREKYNHAYRKLKKDGSLNELCSNIMSSNYRFNYWTQEKCKESALKCESRKIFKEKYPTAYEKSRKNNWLDELCLHMKKNYIDNSKRIIYAYEFTDNYVYVGLTCNLKKRLRTHLCDKDSSVYKHIKETNLIPIYKLLTDYISIFEASEQEIYYIEYYKKIGFTMLNKIKGGGLGGYYIKYNKEKKY
jgi:predicted GIY-YIG superfamily endonuclease